MTENKLNVGELLNELNALAKIIDGKKPERETIEWYLLNNINTYISSIECAQSNNDVENASEVFSRFCTDSMDWDTDLYKMCSEIINRAFKLV